MAVSRVPSPPPPEVNTPVAENWCYTQVRYTRGKIIKKKPQKETQQRIERFIQRIFEHHTRETVFVRLKGIPATGILVVW